MFYIHVLHTFVVAGSCQQQQTYVKPEAAITVFELLMMSDLSSENVEQLRNFVVINSTIRSHLVGYFYTICIMMHGSVNIKYGTLLNNMFVFDILHIRGGRREICRLSPPWLRVWAEAEFLFYGIRDISWRNGTQVPERCQLRTLK